MLMNQSDLTNEVKKFCDQIKLNNNTNGWICGLGHGINKDTPETAENFSIVVSNSS